MTAPTSPTCLTAGSNENPVRTRETRNRVQISKAMALLKNGVDTSVIALWLGHEGTETTQIYLHADMSIKEKALDRVHQPGTAPGRYRPPDTLLAFLDNL
jgi:integrase/recombinase XerD